MKLKFAIALLGLLAVSGGAVRANTLNFSETWNTAGYNINDFTVTANALVDMQYTGGGFTDGFFVLFDAMGDMLISNDDSASLYPHLTQNLLAGSYSLMVTYCCNVLNGFPGGFTWSGTDGFNSGSYYSANAPPATLAGLTAYLDANPFQNYSVYTNSYFINSDVLLVEGMDELPEVPEPASLLLMGAGLTALATARRRRR